MYPDLYKELNLKPEDLTAYDSPLISFDGKMVIPKGLIRLPIQAGSEVVEVDFIVIDAYSPYTAIVGRAWLHALGAISLTTGKSSTLLETGSKSSSGVSPWLGNAWWLPFCTNPKPGPPRQTYSNQRPRRHLSVGRLRKQNVKLPPQEREELIVFLKRNIDVFAWSAYEALEVDPDFICHHLNVNASIIPKKQAPRRSSKEYSNTIRDEVMKLKLAGAIKEVFYPE
ncbi:uncharacterized protein LOC126704174 [Quercus robur]|uniref:uncharacterized protein LOC126704174 n=1 Tax=Quercus robur TaxID=38942 RepID=UPI00216193AC|nr:uncharacterized protein LOC126704174 [Quercus robur]